MEGIRKLLDIPNVEAVLKEYAQQFKELYERKLTQSGRQATGDLIQSVRDNDVSEMVHIGDTEFTVTIDLAHYWKYIENGTRAHWPPQSVILEWVNAKPIIPQPDKNGNIPSPKDLAFLIARAMAGKSPNQANCKNPNGGMQGTHDLEATTFALQEKFRNKLSTALRIDIEDYLSKVWSYKKGGV